MIWMLSIALVILSIGLIFFGFLAYNWREENYHITAKFHADYNELNSRYRDLLDENAKIQLKCEEQKQIVRNVGAFTDERLELLKEYLKEKMVIFNHKGKNDTVAIVNEMVMHLRNFCLKDFPQEETDVAVEELPPVDIQGSEA